MEENPTTVPTPPAPEKELPPLPAIAPVTFDKPQLDAYVEAFRGTAEGPLTIIAREIASEVSRDNPELFSYESLRNGTASFFDYDENLRDVAPAQRALTDAEILSLFAQDTEGNPITGATFMEGVQREALPQTGGMAGFYAGVQAGSRVPLPNPFARLLTAIGGGIIGSLGGYKSGELLTEEVLGPERPILPGQTAAYEQGKTAMGVLAWLPLPFMVSKNVSLGTADYLARLAGQGITNTPRSVRLTQAAENFTSRMGQSARAAPASTVAVEGIIGTGQTVGAGMAEQSYAGDPFARILFETAGGLGAGIAAQPVTTALATVPQWKDSLKSLMETYRAGGLAAALSPLKKRRQEQAVSRIIEILEAEGEDVNAIIERLASSELSELLVDDNGNPIPLTAGAKAGSPALLAIEASLDQLGGALGKERKAAAANSIKALRNAILAMSQTGNQAALQQAADMAEGVFSASLAERLKTATDNVLQASERVAGEGARSNIQLSEKLFDVIDAQLKVARAKERQLWSAVPQVVIPVDTNDPPAFMQAWDELSNMTPEARDEMLRGFDSIKRFVNRKTKELGFAVDDQGAPIPATDDLTSKELSEMRSLAQALGREFDARGESNRARIAYNMAEAFLDDLENVDPEVMGEFAEAYSFARSYSRALNDTFTRSFAGDVLSTTKTGAERIAPELLAKRVLQAGNDPTYLRIKEINDIGTFAAEQGFEGAEQTIATLKGTTEQILRNARAAAFDPNTGEINPTALRRWVNQNEEVLSSFPALKADLENAESANLLLRETSKANEARKAEIKAQLSFYDLMNPVVSEDGRRVFGTESPTTAIARALSRSNKTPIRSLNELYTVILEAPEDLKDPASTGLKSAILEWATTKSGGSMSGSFSPSTMYDSLFAPVPGSENRLSVVQWMRNKDLISEVEVDTLKRFLGEMVKFEGAQASGEIGELVERAGPILDFYLSITGSALGTRAQGLLTGGQGGPGALIAAGRGAETMRRVFSDIPAALQTDVMSELMRNPELLAAMMRKPRGDREKLRLAQRLGQILADLGFRPLRASAPGVVREVERERYDIPETAPEEEAPPPAAPGPDQRSMAVPAPAPTRVAAAPAPALGPRIPAGPQRPIPQTSGPVDRGRFLSLFPSGVAADLARTQQGIGSLM